MSQYSSLFILTADGDTCVIFGGLIFWIIICKASNVRIVVARSGSECEVRFPHGVAIRHQLEVLEDGDFRGGETSGGGTSHCDKVTQLHNAGL